jgi:type II secretory pathway component PulF
MEQDILQKIEEQGRKIDEIYNSVEKIKKYFLWTLIITVVMILIPIIGLIIVIPQFLNIYNAGNLGL